MNGKVYIFLGCKWKSMVWRDKVDPIIKHHLEKEIKESNICKEAYNESKDSGKAQLWCAIANLSKKIFDLNLKLTYLERALKDNLIRKK